LKRGAADVRRDVFEQPHPFADQFGVDICETRNVAAWTRKTFDETEADRIIH
jgi:hypothetical protein